MARCRHRLRRWPRVVLDCGAGWEHWFCSGSGCQCGPDRNGRQLRCTAGLRQRRVPHANAYETGLPRESFDPVFSRFLMCHVPEPARAISEMRSLLKVGGVLVCEDYEQKSVISEPPSRCYKRLNEISNAMDVAFGVGSNIGLKMPRLFQEVGFIDPQVTIQEIVRLYGEESAFGKSRFRRHGLRSCSTGWPPPKSLMRYVQRCDALPRTRQPSWCWRE